MSTKLKRAGLPSSKSIIYTFYCNNVTALGAPMASNSPLSRTPASYSQGEADFIGGQHMSSESKSLETSVVDLARAERRAELM